MNLFRLRTLEFRLRTLEAPPNPLLQAYTAATGRTVQDAVGAGQLSDRQFVPADTTQNQSIFAAMAFFAEHPGVPDHTTPGFPAPTTAEGDLS